MLSHKLLIPVVVMHLLMPALCDSIGPVTNLQQSHNSQKRQCAACCEAILA